MKSLVFVSVLLIGSTCVAFENYDVDMPPTKEPDIQIVRITIDSCETIFKVRKKDFKQFSTSDDAFSQLLDKAEDHKNSGCKK